MVVVRTPGADWRHPEGPGSSIEDRADHPVVHVSLEDVEAYAAFAGKAVPTEAEWEFAARGGLDGAEFAWGDEFMPDGKPQANTWQGDFPLENLLLDGYERTAPVRSFPPNGYGLYEVSGNVWEWTCDWFEDRHRVENACCGETNPRGGRLEASFDPTMPEIRIGRKVLKGGSYLCAPNYCRRYRPPARIAHAVDTSTCHIGFRLLARTPKPAPRSAAGLRQTVFSSSRTPAAVFEIGIVQRPCSLRTVPVSAPRIASHMNELGSLRAASVARDRSAE